MNKKQNAIYEVVDAVVECCSYERPDGSRNITRQMVLSPERISENCDMTRCILVRQLKVMGYTNESIADILGRSETTIRDMFQRGDNYDLSSYAYHIAAAEAAIKLRILMGKEQ